MSQATLIRNQTFSKRRHINTPTESHKHVPNFMAKLSQSVTPSLITNPITTDRKVL